MKIGIDARLLERRMTGIGRYVENIVQHIPQCDQENEYVLFSYRPLPGFPKGNVRNVATMDAIGRGPHELYQKYTQIKKGDRIAQGVVCPVVRADIEVVDYLDETNRGKGGFGSTGLGTGLEVRK